MKIIIPSNLDAVLNTITSLDFSVNCLADYYGFAQINDNNIVTNCIIADFDFIQMYANQINCNFVLYLSQTKYKKEEYRGKFCEVGMVWDLENQVFYDPQPYPSWKLNTNLWIWEPPICYPSDGNFYIWSEDTQNWIKPSSWDTITYDEVLSTIDQGYLTVDQLCKFIGGPPTTKYQRLFLYHDDIPLEELSQDLTKT